VVGGDDERRSGGEREGRDGEERRNEKREEGRMSESKGKVKGDKKDIFA